jgi:hypothetical protein
MFSNERKTHFPHICYAMNMPKSSKAPQAGAGGAGGTFSARFENK